MSLDSGLLVAVALVVLVLVVALGFAAWFGLRRFGPGRSDRAETGRPNPAPAVGGMLESELRALAAAGQWSDAVRLLDRSLPEWPVAGALVEAVRGVAALNEDVARARRIGVSPQVTERLEAQVASAADDLWSLADRIAAVDRVGYPRLREGLERHDQALVRLSDAMREARQGLAELSLTGVAGPDELRRAEGRFRALAAASRELHEWEQESPR